MDSEKNLKPSTIAPTTAMWEVGWKLIYAGLVLMVCHWTGANFLWAGAMLLVAGVLVAVVGAVRA